MRRSLFTNSSAISYLKSCSNMLRGSHLVDCCLCLSSRNGLEAAGSDDWEILWVRRLQSRCHRVTWGTNQSDFFLRRSKKAFFTLSWRKGKRSKNKVLENPRNSSLFFSIRVTKKMDKRTVKLYLLYIFNFNISKIHQRTFIRLLDNQWLFIKMLLNFVLKRETVFPHVQNSG